MCCCGCRGCVRGWLGACEWCDSWAVAPTPRLPFRAAFACAAVLHLSKPEKQQTGAHLLGKHHDWKAQQVEERERGEGHRSGELVATQAVGEETCSWKGWKELVVL